MPKAFVYGQAGGGINDTLPTMPGDFAYALGDGRVTLTFTPPVSNYGGAIIVRKAGSVPAGLNDGVKLQASGGSYIDTGLTNKTTYYWRLFPYNEKKQYQTALGGAVVSGMPVAAAVPSFSGDHTIYGDEWKGYMVIRSNGTFAANSDMVVDVFVVDGGSAGGNTNYYAEEYIGGYGGSGGKYINIYGVELGHNSVTEVLIGAGGTPTSVAGASKFGTLLATIRGASGGRGASKNVETGDSSPGSAGSDGVYLFTGDQWEFVPKRYSAGGGGGGSYGYTGYAGGADGAGRGGNSSGYGVAATANSGSGGGGGGAYINSSSVYKGGNGGSGIIIVRWGYAQ